MESERKQPENLPGRWPMDLKSSLCASPLCAADMGQRRALACLKGQSKLTSGHRWFARGEEALGWP